MTIIIFISSWAIFYLSGKYLFGKKGNLSSGKNNKIFIISLILSILVVLIKSYLGSERPSTLFEKNQYECEVYVNIFPEGSLSKNYRLAAKIESYIESDNDESEHNSWRVYKLKYVRFPNGDQVTFYDSDESLQLGKKVNIRDDDGTYWDIELTNDIVRDDNSNK